jgi:hypothetical protein
LNASRLETTVNTKATALLLAAAAVLFAFVYFVERPIRLAALIPPNRNVLPGLDPAKITAVQVQIAGGVRSIRADKTNQAWQLTQPESYPASGPLIENLLLSLAQWEWQSSIDHPDSWDQYGLVRDQFTLLLQQDGQDRILKIGRLSPAGDQVYLNARGSDRILVANPDLLHLIPTDQFQWRDLTVLNLAGLPFLKLKVHSTNWDLVLQRDATNGLWKMTKPIEARADTPKISDWLAQLQALRVQRFLPDDAREPEASGLPGPPPTQQLVLTFLRDSGDSNKVLELQVGNSPAARTNRAFARRLQPPGLIEIDNAPLLPWEGDWTNFVDRHLLSLPPDLIGAIAVSGAGLEKFTVQKAADGPWSVHCAGGETFPADPLLMKEWFFALTNIQVETPRSPTADKSLFGLDNPADTLLRYQLFYPASSAQTNPLMADLLFGRGTNQPSRIFEMGGDEKYVNSIDLQQFSLLPNACWELRDRAIWHFLSNQVLAIDIHQLGGELRYTRDTNHQWVLPHRYYNLTPVQPAIEETLYRLGQLRAIYWSGCGDDHLERFGFDQTDYRISFEIINNGHLETNTIQFGKPSPYLHPYASVLRDGRRLIFEFPVDLYSNLVVNYLAVPAAYQRPQ